MGWGRQRCWMSRVCVWGMWGLDVEGVCMGDVGEGGEGVGWGGRDSRSQDSWGGGDARLRGGEEAGKHWKRECEEGIGSLLDSVYTWTWQCSKGIGVGTMGAGGAIAPIKFVLWEQHTYSVPITFWWFERVHTNFWRFECVRAITDIYAHPDVFFCQLMLFRSVLAHRYTTR